MRGSMNYRDAVKVLGGGEIPLLEALDEATSAAVVAAGRFDLIEVQRVVIELGAKALAGIGSRVRGTARLTRLERLRAAHAIILTTAFFEALDDVLAKSGLRKAIRLGAVDQAAMAAGTPHDAKRRDLAVLIAATDIGEPSPVHTRYVVGHLATLARSTAAYIKGLAVWDTLNETRRDRLATALDQDLARLALANYEAHLRRLAAESPEFNVWLSLAAHREAGEEIRTGLAGLETLLTSIADRDTRSGRTALARAHRAALGKPIMRDEEAKTDLAIPTLAEAYIDHRFRAAGSPGSVDAGDDQSWDREPVRDDLYQFLAAHLVSGEAVSAPLLVLGHPGSGKSVLTRILAARLPESDFLPVRVALRRVDADAELQDQIETAIRLATGETVHWPRLVESAPEALPVVMLDGFDELLQATGVAQTDFLQRVARFQEREAEQNRPLAVIVTSRTAVAHRATLPPASTVVHLEPFDAEQVGSWVATWNRANHGILAERGLRPLALRAVLDCGELAEQPLMLVMLALYDVATGNGLAQLTHGLDRADTYEELFKAFVRREISKDPDTTDLEHRVELELVRLSVVAFAMFNRGQQWVDDKSLTKDLDALGVGVPSRRPGGDFRAPLSPGELIVGKFYFVHGSKATREGQVLQTYEFLHATFGEYLVARLVANLLGELASAELASSPVLRGPVGDGLLHAVASFECLAARGPVVEFLASLVGRRPEPVRRAMAEVLLRLFRTAHHARTESAYAGYQPYDADVVKRHATWSANLILLATIAAGEIDSDQFSADPEDGAVGGWARSSVTWYAQLRAAAWEGLIANLSVQRGWRDGRRIVRLRLAGTDSLGLRNLRWTHNSQPDRRIAGSGPYALPDTPRQIQSSNFMVDYRSDLLNHAVEPLTAAFPTVANSVYPLPDGRLVSVANALLTAVAAPAGGAAFTDLAALVKEMKQLRQSSEEAEAFVKVALRVLRGAVQDGLMPSSVLMISGY